MCNDKDRKGKQANGVCPFLVPVLVSPGCFYELLSLPGSYMKKELHFFLHVMKLEIPFQKLKLCLPYMLVQVAC